MTAEVPISSDSRKVMFTSGFYFTSLRQEMLHFSLEKFVPTDC